jgi:hypothetical protein
VDPERHSIEERVMPSSHRGSSVRRFVVTLAVAASLGIGVPGIGRAQNAVTDWVNIVQPSINNASAPRA